MINKDSIKALKENSAFRDFQDHVLNQVAVFDTVRDLSHLTDQEAGQTAKARELAMELLGDIFAPFVEFREKRKFSDEQIKAAKSKFGL